MNSASQTSREEVAKRFLKTLFASSQNGFAKMQSVENKGKVPPLRIFAKTFVRSVEKSQLKQRFASSQLRTPKGVGAACEAAAAPTPGARRFCQGELDP